MIVFSLDTVLFTNTSLLHIVYFCNRKQTTLYYHVGHFVCRDVQEKVMKVTAVNGLTIQLDYAKI